MDMYECWSRLRLAARSPSCLQGQLAQSSTDRAAPQARSTAAQLYSNAIPHVTPLPRRSASCCTVIMVPCNVTAWVAGGVPSAPGPGSSTWLAKLVHASCSHMRLTCILPFARHHLQTHAYMRTHSHKVKSVEPANVAVKLHVCRPLTCAAARGFKIVPTYDHICVRAWHGKHWLRSTLVWTVTCSCCN